MELLNGSGCVWPFAKLYNKIFPMSGPKIIDVKAVRAEQERQWAKLRHQLEQAIAACDKLAATLPASVHAAKTLALRATLKKLDTQHVETALPRLLGSLLDDAAKQLDFVKVESAWLRDQAMSAWTERLRHQRGMRAAVDDAADRLHESGELALRDQLLADPSESNLAAALRVLSANVAAAQLHTVAAALGSESVAISVDDWLATHALPADPALVRIDSLAAELAILSGSSDVELWLRRLEALRSMTDERSRRLHTDSLVMELSESIAATRREVDRQAALDVLDAELIAFANPPAELCSEIASCRAAVAADVTEVRTKVVAWCSAEAVRQDSARSRQLILTTLRDLGYDVREGMATAWAEQGRLVVRQPGSAEYGVELTSVNEARMKTQLVRFGTAGAATEAQRQRDVEMEGKWCGAHEAVLQELSDQGLAATILAARAPGATAVTVLLAPDVIQADRSAVAKPSLRELR
jgi:hypothetical protein